MLPNENRIGHKSVTVSSCVYSLLKIMPKNHITPPAQTAFAACTGVGERREAQSLGSKGLFKRQGTKDKGLGDHLAEGDEGPADVPVVAELALAEPAVAADEGRAGHAEAVIGAAPALVVLGDAGVVAGRVLDPPEPLREGADVALGTLLAEVVPDSFRGDDLSRLEIGLPDHQLELLAAARDGLAVEADVEVPPLLIEVEVGELALAVQRGGELDGGEAVWDEDDVLGDREATEERDERHRHRVLEVVATRQELLDVVLGEAKLRESGHAHLMDESQNSVLLPVGGGRDRASRHHTFPSPPYEHPPSRIIPQRQSSLKTALLVHASGGEQKYRFQ